MSLKRYLGKGYQFDGLFLFKFIFKVLNHRNVLKDIRELVATNVAVQNEFIETTINFLKKELEKIKN